MNNFGVMYCTYDRPRAVIQAGRQLKSLMPEHGTLSRVMMQMG